MVNTRFEMYKVKRELKRSGTEYEFKRFEMNEFGEPGKKILGVGSLCGLYHEQNSNIQITTGDTTQVRTKKIPMILCLYESAISLVLQVGDFTIINNRIYKVTGITNVQEWNIVADISLEVVDNGTPA